MSATVPSLTDRRRRQEDLAWQSNAVIADYLTARLADNREDEKAAIKAAKEIDAVTTPGPRLMDEINALRTRRHADAA